MLLLYVLAGAAAFLYLEADNKKAIYEDQKQRISKATFLAADGIWLDLHNHLTKNISEVEFKSKVIQMLKSYDNILNDGAYNKLDVRQQIPGYQWNYKNSLFFTATLITTIGE